MLESLRASGSTLGKLRLTERLWYLFWVIGKLVRIKVGSQFFHKE